MRCAKKKENGRVKIVRNKKKLKLHDLTKKNYMKKTKFYVNTVELKYAANLVNCTQYQTKELNPKYVPECQINTFKVIRFFVQSSFSVYETKMFPTNM